MGAFPCRRHMALFAPFSKGKWLCCLWRYGSSSGGDSAMVGFCRWTRGATSLTSESLLSGPPFPFPCSAPGWDPPGRGSRLLYSLFRHPMVLCLCEPSEGDLDVEAHDMPRET